MVWVKFVKKNTSQVPTVVHPLIINNLEQAEFGCYLNFLVMSSQSTPLILLVPGAFGTPDGYGPLLPYLKEAGFTTHPGPYPSSNPADPAAATCAGDIASLRDDTLRPLIEEQKDIVILAHSYGAIVASGAAKGLDKKSRSSEGLAGGVIGLIYIAGNIVLDNESLGEALGGANPPFIKLDKVCLYQAHSLRRINLIADL